MSSLGTESLDFYESAAHESLVDTATSPHGSLPLMPCLAHLIISWMAQSESSADQLNQGVRADSLVSYTERPACSEGLDITTT